MEELCGKFSPSAVDNLQREAHYGGTFGYNGMFIWHDFGILPLTTLLMFNISNDTIYVWFK